MQCASLLPWKICSSNLSEPEHLKMEQDLNKIENAYNAMAREWAAAFSDEHEKKPEDLRILGSFAEKIGKRKPVWDFGCGPGNTSKYLKNLGVGISGLDLSEKMLEEARKINPEISFSKGNILKPAFENNSIAGIVAFYAIVHFTEEEVKKAFREIFRVLQPGGIFLLAYHIGEKTIHLDEFLGKKVDMDFMFFSCDFISGSLENCGFEDIETIERDPYPGVEYPSRRAYVFAQKPYSIKTF